MVTDALRATVGAPEGMYGRRKMTAYLRRQGYPVAACTVDRLMSDEGLSGVVRGRAQRTTIRAKDGVRAGDLLNRDRTATAPNQRWVADFTYCRTWAGFVYVAFAIGRNAATRSGKSEYRAVVAQWKAQQAAKRVSFVVAIRPRGDLHAELGERGADRLMAGSAAATPSDIDWTAES